MKLEITLFIACFTMALNAQNISAEFSDTQQAKERFLFPYMVQGSADSLYVFAFDEYLHTSMWSLENKDLEWQPKYRTIPSSSNSLSPFKHNGKWWAQRAFWAEAGTDSTLKVDLVRLNERLLPDNEPIVIFDELPKTPLPMRVEKRVSPNGRHKAFFAIQDYVHPKAPGMHWLMDSETEVFYFAILDADSLKINKKGKVVLPLKRVGERLSVKDFTVDNNGKIIVLADAITRKQDNAIQTPHLRPTTYFVNPDNNEVSFYEWPFDRQYITNLNIALDAENNLICAGFYSETSYEKRKGLVYVKLDARRTKVLKKELCPFPTVILQKMHPKKSALDGQESLAHDIYFFKISTSGHLWVVAEEQVFDGGNSYWFNDLWVFAMAPEGKFTNAHYIKKRTRRDGVLRSSHLGFNAFLDGEELCLFYNDFKNKSLIINRIAIGQNPKTERIPLPSRLRVMPSPARQTNRGECVLLLTDDEFGQLKLMRVKLR